MAQDRNKDSNENKQHVDNYRSNRAKKDKSFQTKVVVRRLPPTMTEEQFLEQVSPVPDHDYFYYVKADLRLGQNAFSRAYVNFVHQDDIFVFKDKFDGYVFVDAKGGEYPAIVEFAPFQKIPKKRSKKRDAKCGTIETDPDYLSYLESLKKPDVDSSLPPAESYLEEIETKEKELRANNGVPKITTPLIEYLKQRKIEQQKIREEKREERKRKEIEKKRLREEERRRRKAEKDRAKEKQLQLQQQQQLEAETHASDKGGNVTTADTDKSKSQEDQKLSDTVVQVLKNPEREKETKDHVPPQKSKEFYTRSYKDRERNRREWESDRNRQKDRNRGNDKVIASRDKDHHYSGGREKMEFRPSSSYKKSEERNFPASSSSNKSSNLSSSTAAESKTVEKKASSAGSATYAQDKSYSKTKRDKSCPGVVEMSSGCTDQQGKSCGAKEVSSASEDNYDVNDGLKGDDGSADNNKQLSSKDPRTERRIRNKDRPSLEIYRPGLRRFNVQRNSPHKEISTSTSNSSTPSPSPTPPLNTTGTKVQVKGDNEKSKVQKTNSAESQG